MPKGHLMVRERPWVPGRFPTLTLVPGRHPMTHQRGAALLVPERPMAHVRVSARSPMALRQRLGQRRFALPTGQRRASRPWLDERRLLGLGHFPTALLRPAAPLAPERTVSPMAPALMLTRRRPAGLAPTRSGSPTVPAVPTTAVSELQVSGRLPTALAALQVQVRRQVSRQEPRRGWWKHPTARRVLVRPQRERLRGRRCPTLRRPGLPLRRAPPMSEQNPTVMCLA